ncbi:MAG: integrase, partial [Saccharolobus sp.]
MIIDVSGLTEDQKIRIIEEVLRNGISYDELGIDRSSWWRYKSKKRKIPDNVVEKAIEYLAPDDLIRLTYSIDINRIGINEAIGVIVKA